MDAETPTSTTRASDRRFSRRTLLGLIAAGVTGGAGLFYATRGREHLLPWEQDVLGELSRTVELDDDLGRAAVEIIGEERPGELARRLFSAHRAAEPDVTAALDHLREQVRRDYADGRTHTLEGWELSETEVVLFALLYAADQRQDS